MKKRMTLLGLIASTYFMVSGGPYGLEDLIAGAGYRWALVALFVVPLIWSLPTALMVGELAAAIPDRGGYYVWVKRALGEFWGFQEAWFSLAGSVFDMAIYPTLFLAYLGMFSPELAAGWHGIAIGVALIAACLVWNLAGARAVGEGSIVLGVFMATPFIVLTVAGLFHSHLAPSASEFHSNLGAGIMVAMWNFMGWDNASTIASEVENPQRNYPRAMAFALAIVVIEYALPVSGMWYVGVPLSSWSTGSWASIGGEVAGPLLRDAIVLGGLISSAGMLNSLMLSYTRLPVALAEDGYLPNVLRRMNRFDVPWVSLIFCSIAWALCLGLNFDKLVMLDILLYGTSLVLEFVALAVLRWKEPDLVRPFRVPGGKIGVTLIGVMPCVLLVVSGFSSDREGLGLGAEIGVVGLVVWAAAALSRAFRRRAHAGEVERIAVQVEVVAQEDD